MKKRLKDKIWKDVIIKIDRLVEQYQDNISIENKCVAFLITIEHGQGRKTMFRVDNQKNLWKEIAHHAMVYK